MRCLTLFFQSIIIYLILSKVLSNIVYANTPTEDIELFRNIFYTFAKSKYTDGDITKMVLYPPQAMFLPPVETTGHDSYLAYKENSKHISYSDMLTRSLEKGFKSIDNPESVFSKTGPITIFVLPGFSTEIYPSYPFQEILENRNTAFSIRFRKNLIRAANEARTTKIISKVFSLQELSEVDTSIERVLKVGSIDSESSGEPLVQIVYLYPKLMAMDTLVSAEVAADRFIRRIDKFIDIMGPMENIYFLGYSFGTSIGLEILSNIHESKTKPLWFANVKGMISLGGTVFGADIASALHVPGNKYYKTIQCASMIENLSEDGSLSARAFNLRLLGRISACFTNSLTKIFAALINARFKTKPLGPENLTVPIKLIEELWSCDRQKIVRLKYFAKTIVKTFKSIAESERLEWFATHTLPPHIGYYSISGSMPEVVRKNARRGNRGFFNNWLLGPTTFGFMGLRMLFRDIYKLSGSHFNDGIVGTYQSIFLPGVHAQLNSQQYPYKATIIGIAGTHHAGLGLANVLKTIDQKQNNYPRSLLIKAIATFIAMKQE